MTRRLRLVLDTNVLVSAFLWQGTPGRLIELAGACACAARADLIVTGDDDLLVLKVFEGVSIVSPARALDRIGTAERGTSEQGES